jgi:hypothetical protein
MNVSSVNILLNIANKRMGTQKPKISDPAIDSILDQMEEIPQAAIAASKWLTDIYVRLGRPQSPFTESGEKLVNVIIATWKELYPQEASDWFDTKRDYQKEELDITSQVHQKTGRSLASYPYPVYKMLRQVFPTIKFGERKTAIKMARRFPIFKFANRI